MSAGQSVLSREGLLRFLPRELAPLCRFFPEIDSTNTYLKAQAGEGAPHGTAAVAAMQTAGRGRRGRSFYSPAGCGIYLSVLLRGLDERRGIPFVTTAAAVAVCRAVERAAGVVPGIKWVNDLQLGGRKFVGILCERAGDATVVGIGINFAPPPGGYPEEIAGTATALCRHTDRPADINALAAAVIEEVLSQPFDPADFLPYYRARSVTLGRAIQFERNGAHSSGTAVAIDDEGGLVVELEGGERTTLRSGEVTVRAL